MNLNDWLGRINPELNVLWRGTWKRGTVEPGRYLHDHELVVVSHGGCRVRLEEEVYRLEAGSFLIIPPARLHSTLTQARVVQRHCFHFDWRKTDFRTRPSAPWVYHPKRLQPRLCKPAPEFVPRAVRWGRFDLHGPIPSLIETIFHRWNGNRAAERQTSRFLFGELLVRLLWNEGAEPPRRHVSWAYRVKELLDTADDAHRLPLQQLLPQAGLSYAHLCREFRQQFGLTPARYRNMARLERAKELLRDPSRTVAEAADAAGFRDPAYFSRLFRRCYGAPPSRLRG